MPEKLVLGHAGKEHDDAVTVDIDPGHNPSVVHDLNVVPYPFEAQAFSEIYCHHVLEHLENIGPVMKELHRICAAGGEVYIEVPHHTSWCANVPEHKLRFNYFAFDGYIDVGGTNWQRANSLFRLKRRELTFHRNYRMFFLHKLFNAFPEAYERFFAYLFPAEHFKIWLEPIA